MNIAKVHKLINWLLTFSSDVQVEEINTKIVDAEFENTRLDSENAKLQAELNVKVSPYFV